MNPKKTPALLGADTGGICERQDRHFTANQLKSAQVHHQHGDTLRTKAKAPVIQNTFVQRSNRPDSAALSCSNSVTGFWADGPFREAGRTACTSVLNICPPLRFKTQVEPKTCTRSMIMPEGTTTPTSGNTTHDHHQAALVLRATTHLSEALYQLRSSSGTTPTRKAMGLAYAAGRALSQVVGGAV